MRKAKNQPHRTERPRRGCLLVSALLGLSGLLCAAVLGSLFYLTVVWQTAPTAPDDAQTPSPTAYTASDTASDTAPDMLTLPTAALAEESERQSDVGGERCRAVTRKYALPDGGVAYAVTAWPAAYLEWMAVERYVPQPVTGYILGGLDAVYAAREDSALLCACSGDAVYMLLTDADKDMLYALGAAAVIGQ